MSEVDVLQILRDTALITPNGRGDDEDPSLGESNPFHGEQAELAGFGDQSVTLDEFVARTADDVAPLIETSRGPLLPRAGLALVAGRTSSGKTTWLIDLLLHAAAGADHCGLSFTRPLRVLLIENEGPREGFRSKVEQRLKHGPGPIEPIRIWDDPHRWGAVKVSHDDIREALVGAIEKHRIDLLVSDTLTRFGVVGNGTPEDTRDFVDLLVRLGLGQHVAVLLLHHTLTRPDSKLDEIETIAGAWAPHADAILMVKRLDGNRTRLSFPKTRYSRGIVPAAILAFDDDAETFTHVATDDETGDDQAAPETYEQRILDFLADHPWATTDQLSGVREARDAGLDVVLGRAEELRKARHRLEQAGHLTKAPSQQVGHPGKGMRWNLALQQESIPVPPIGTPPDGPLPEPAQNGQPRPPVPTSKRDGGRDGVAGQTIEKPPQVAAAERLTRAVRGTGVDFGAPDEPVGDGRPRGRALEWLAAHPEASRIEAEVELLTRGLTETETAELLELVDEGGMRS